MALQESGSVACYCQHPILALGLESLFLRCDDLRITVTNSPEELIQIAGRTQPDIIVLDNGPKLDLELLANSKRVAAAAKTVLWLDSIQPEQAFQAVNAGVRGILWKSLKPDEFLEHLRGIRKGQIRIEDDVMSSIRGVRSVSLTKRESELVTLLAQGLKNKEIATELKIAENTVKAYLSRLFQKLNVKDRLDLALYALKNMPSTHENGGPPSPTDGLPVMNHRLRPISSGPLLSLRQM